jgi:non-specific serine/threonine protein kinase
MRLWHLAAAVSLLFAGCTDGSGPTPAPTGLAWRTLKPALSERTEVAAAPAGTSIYVMGGFRADGGTVATVEILDTATGTWKAGPDLPLPVNHAMAASTGGAVYLFGGYDGNGSPSTGAFRLESQAWQPIALMPEPRAAATAAAIDGRIYVAGGVGAGGVLASRMLVYDTGTDSWATAPGLPTAREHLGGAAFGGRLYAVGGRTGAGNLASLESFDPGTRQWSKHPDMPTPRGGMAAAATCAGWIVAVGGEARTTFREVEAFDTASGTWLTLPTPRHGLGVVTVGRTLYVLAGGPQPGLHVAATVEAIDLPSC